MKEVHIISHSHWDREWYMPFEYHRAYLVKLIDDCMELFEKDKDFVSFHLDGHTALVEDYLEIKPENEKLIKKYVKEGRFHVGPWYVLQDEFLTSSEANIRNLLTGLDLAESLGGVTRIGYFPDSFGNAGQMPQILKQAGMKAIAFGRGVKPTGANNEIYDDGYSSYFSELYWKAPDGSRLPAILFANWYNNGWDMPEDGDEKYWDRALSDAEKYASCDKLLMMNGCDHQPVQKNLSKAIAAAKKKYPSYRFIHSDFESYVKAVFENPPKNLSEIRGELTGRDTDGWGTLVNTASSHQELKAMNRRNEILLENVAEPVSVIASRLGMKYPAEMLRYSWKTLMKNHPHDSICGCSCDEVNDEMRTRFLKSMQSGEMITHDALMYIARHIKTPHVNDTACASFAVINTCGRSRSIQVTADVDVKRIYEGECFDFDNLHNAYESLTAELGRTEYYVADKNGNAVSARLENERVRFGYDLPEDGFRKPYMAKTVTVKLEAADVQSMGYRVFAVCEGTVPKKKAGLVKDKNTMENAYIRVSINADGTVDVTDKKANRVYSGLLRLEDVGDIGTEYTFVPVQNDKPIYSGDSPAKIELLCDEDFMAEYKVTVPMQIPESADSDNHGVMVNLKNRTGERSKELTTLEVALYLTLTATSKGLGIRCEFENTAKDHRLRMLFPTGLLTDTHRAEAVFEAVRRSNKHKPTWTYPSGCDHQQGFCMMEDEKSGIMVANIGLYEYEISEDNTIAVTLVRATSEMGDWGVFPTELSQVRTKLTADLTVIPYRNENEAFFEAECFNYPSVFVQLSENEDSNYKNGGFIWQGDGLRMTAFKGAQKNDDIIMRWVNYTDKELILKIEKTDWIDNLYASNVIEKKGEKIKAKDGVWQIPVKPYEIITLGCEKKESFEIFPPKILERNG